MRCPCFSHALNLPRSKSSSVQNVRNFMGIIAAATACFALSSKRNAVLRLVLKGQLPGLCETRWVERHNAVQELRSSLADILRAADTTANWKNQTSSAAKASILIAALQTSNFLVVSFSMSDIFALAQPLCRLSQKETLDLQTAVELLHDR